MRTHDNQHMRMPERRQDEEYFEMISDEEISHQLDTAFSLG
jgi:hypothetical protein